MSWPVPKHTSEQSAWQALEGGHAQASRQAGVSAMLPAGAHCVAALMMWLTQDLDASALAHIREVVEGAIPVGGRSDDEHARAVLGG